MNRLQSFFPDIYRRFRRDIEVVTLVLPSNEKEIDIDLCNSSHYRSKTSCVKGFSLDFGSDVTFHLQIFFNSKKMFTQPEGAKSDYFYSAQPGFHTAWAAQTKFFYPEHGSANFLEMEISPLKQNGMGLFLFEREDINYLKEFNTHDLRFRFRFADTAVRQNQQRFALYVFRES